jgi:hypothetical protein
MSWRSTTVYVNYDVHGTRQMLEFPAVMQRRDISFEPFKDG